MRNIFIFVRNVFHIFLLRWDPNLSDFMVYFCLFQNAILHRVEAAIQRCSLKSCSENMQQIYRRTPMPKYDFNKVACIFSEHLFLRTPLNGCFCIGLKLGFWHFKPIFLRMQFSLVATFFLYFWLSVWVEICILNFLMSFQHLYHLTFGDKSVRVLDFHIWN